MSMTNKRLKWGVAVVWVGVIASALAVVYVSHNCRMLYGELASLEQEYNRMQVEWGQYLLEQSALASLSSIEQIAHEKLNMRAPTPDDIVVVRP